LPGLSVNAFHQIYHYLVQYLLMMAQYVLRKTLAKHGDSVNALAFSYDGSLFASGADDGLVIVFRGNGCGRELRRFQVKAPVTTLLWHSHFGYTIIAGDASGDIHTICLNSSTNVSVTHFPAYVYIDGILFTEKWVLSHREQRPWPCPQHCANWYIAGHQFRKRCAVSQARDYRSDSFSYLTCSQLGVTIAGIGSYLGCHRPASRPTQIPRTRRGAARTYGTIAPLLGS
jgi:WD40 repeat protein